MAELPSSVPEEGFLEPLEAEQGATSQRGLSRAGLALLLPHTARRLLEESTASEAAQLLASWGSTNQKRQQILETEGMRPALVRALELPKAAFYAAEALGNWGVQVRLVGSMEKTPWRENDAGNRGRSLDMSAVAGEGPGLVLCDTTPAGHGLCMVSLAASYRMRDDTLTRIHTSHMHAGI